MTNHETFAVPEPVNLPIEIPVELTNDVFTRLASIPVSPLMALLITINDLERLIWEMSILTLADVNDIFPDCTFVFFHSTT